MFCSCQRVPVKIQFKYIICPLCPCGRNLALPCVLQCSAWEGSGGGQRSCDWFRCQWETASSRWHTSSRLSSPDPKRMGLWKEDKDNGMCELVCVRDWLIKNKGQQPGEPYYAEESKEIYRELSLNMMLWYFKISCMIFRSTTRVGEHPLGISA